MADRIVLGRPEPSDCNEYYFLYIDRVPTGDVLGLLEEQLESTAGFLLGLEASRLDYRYAPGKWSVKEVVGHVIDVERTFSYRAMCGARNEPADLPSFEQDRTSKIHATERDTWQTSCANIGRRAQQPWRYSTRSTRMSGCVR